MLKLDRLKLVCTDRRTHPKRQIALVMWSPDDASGDAQVWEAKLDPPNVKVEAIEETVRRSARGDNHVTNRTAVATYTRADGGTTFRLPPCPTCRRETELRDNTLDKIRRSWPDTRPVDISELP